MTILVVAALIHARVEIGAWASLLFLDFVVLLGIMFVGRMVVRARWRDSANAQHVLGLVGLTLLGFFMLTATLVAAFEQEWLAAGLFVALGLPVVVYGIIMAELRLAGKEVSARRLLGRDRRGH